MSLNPPHKIEHYMPYKILLNRYKNNTTIIKLIVWRLTPPCIARLICLGLKEIANCFPRRMRIFKDLVVKPLLILTVEGYLVINIFVLVLMTRPLLPVVRVGFVGLDNFHREFWVFHLFESTFQGREV